MLEQGGTVVVPSRQRAVAVRLAHTRAMLERGALTWPSCEVYAWSAWLQRCAQRARQGALRGRRCLGGHEEWLLWREAVEEAAESSGVLLPAVLADPLRRADRLVRDWGMAWRGVPSAEAALFAQARERFSSRCQSLGAYCANDWPLVLGSAQSAATRPGAAPLLFAGFASLGTALKARLQELGAVFKALEEPAPAGGSVEIQACADATDELRRAALWCRERLQRDPGARVLVVVPHLAQRRALAVQAFDHVLHGGALLHGLAEPLFAIEGGQALASYPLVETALGLLALTAGTLEFPELAALLRSPYFACGTLAQRAALELLLRETNVLAADLGTLSRLARSARGARGARGAGDGTLAPLADALAALASLPRPPAPRDSPAGWARCFADLLKAAGWPGEAALGSDEQQQRERFRELLGELALLGAGGTPLTPADALELLRAMARRTAFESASADVPVTLTQSIDDPLVHYDGIWVAGLSAEHWPAPPRPDPFVPIAAQRAAGYAQASAAGQLALAAQAMAQWRRCTPQLVLSWAGQDGEVALQPSTLLDGYSTAPRPAGAACAPVTDPLVAALRGGAVHEERSADRAGPWPGGQRLPAGTRALELQSWCPFRAAAELRLGAAPVAEPVPGLDRFERGLLLHRALELTWTELGDSRTLRAQAAAGQALAQLARAVSARALAERLAVRACTLPRALIENEAARLARLIEALLRAELQRAEGGDFAVAQLEYDQEHELAGQRLRLRMDRLDRLGDGRLVVIDYKSGKARTFGVLEPRPRQPQLLAYAQLAPGELAAVAAVYLNADEIAWRGVAAEAAVLPALGRAGAAPMPWPQLQAHWRDVIDRLVRGFAAGDAAVDPLPGVCANCHLPALCRIDPARQQPAAAEEAPDEP